MIPSQDSKPGTQEPPRMFAQQFGISYKRVRNIVKHDLGIRQFKREHRQKLTKRYPVSHPKATMKWIRSNIEDSILTEHWPSNSPDLTVCDYRIWSAPVKEVNQPGVKIHDINHIQQIPEKLNVKLFCFLHTRYIQYCCNSRVYFFLFWEMI